MMVNCLIFLQYCTYVIQYLINFLTIVIFSIAINLMCKCVSTYAHANNVAYAPSCKASIYSCNAVQDRHLMYIIIMFST